MHCSRRCGVSPKADNCAKKWGGVDAPAMLLILPGTCSGRGWASSTSGPCEPKSSFIDIMHKVLFIAYYYPPLGGIGSQRSQKFAYYLPDHGWQPLVLTPEHGSYVLDTSPDTGESDGGQP